MVIPRWAPWKKVVTWWCPKWATASFTTGPLCFNFCRSMYKAMFHLPFFLHPLKPLNRNPMRKHENCKYCGKPLKGRSDKECCNNKCKSQYHNKKNRNPELPENITKKSLHRNYKLLKRFWGYERRFRSMLPLSLLISEGFDLSTYTEITMHPESGWRIRWVYNLGLLFNLNTNRYQLHRRDSKGNLLF
jgi:hypothetical protein